MKATLGEGEDHSTRIHPPTKKNNPKNPKERDLRQRGLGPKSLHGAHHVVDLIFKPPNPSFWPGH